MLPAEMRNNIYELVYAIDTSEDNEIDLLTAKRPSNALILTCRQIHNETAKIYKSSYRDFWSKSSFVLHTEWQIDYLNPERSENHLQCLRAQDIQHITRLELRLHRSHGCTPHSRVYTLLWPNAWRSRYEIRDVSYRGHYYYLGRGQHGGPRWYEFVSEGALTYWREQDRSGDRIDLVYQINHIIEASLPTGILVLRP